MRVDGNVGGGPDGTSGGSFTEVRAQALEARSCGLDGVWSTEVTRNPFLPLLVAAEAAPTMTVGTAIAVAFATNPMSMATLAHDMQSYTEGRFMLGLGSQVRPHIERRFSMPWSSPADRMSEFIQALRAIWSSWASDTPLNFEGTHYRHTLMTPMFTPPPHPWEPPPVLLAAVGDRMTEVAAREADGIILHSFTTPEFLAGATHRDLTRTLDLGGRRREDFIVSLPGLVAVGDTETEMASALKAVRDQVAFYASTPAYRRVLDHHGWGDLHTELHALSRRGDWTTMSRLVDDEVLERFAVVGSPEEAGREIARRFAGLVDRFTIAAPYALAPEQRGRVVAALKSAVMTPQRRVKYPPQGEVDDPSVTVRSTCPRPHDLGASSLR